MGITDREQRMIVHADYSELKTNNGQSLEITSLEPTATEFATSLSTINPKQAIASTSTDRVKH